MIQFKRGKTENWYKQGTPLADGQPGYDRDTHKIKIGDGKLPWVALPSAGGLSSDEILSSEKEARSRRTFFTDALNKIRSILTGDFNEIVKKRSPAVFTYGTEAPDTNTVGQVYLQHYDAEPEVDYVVESGIGNGWVYQKWSSGIAKCSISLVITTTVQTELGESLFKNSTEISRIKYPFKFISTAELKTPSEVATVQSPGGLVWLATAKNGTNTLEKSASYYIVSANKQDSSAEYKISVSVTGFWR